MPIVCAGRSLAIVNDNAVCFSPGFKVGISFTRLKMVMNLIKMVQKTSNFYRPHLNKRLD